MAKTENGEYEMILGTRQLLSLFFVVVVLLGVGFTLGYILGRNSAGAGDLTAEAKPVETTTKVTLPDPPTEVERPSAAPLKKAEPAPASVTPPAAAEAASGGVRTGTPPPGSAFLQIAAVGRKDAEMEAKMLAEKGFPLWIAPNERNRDLYSVLVGPYNDRSEFQKARTSLAELGFRKAFRKEFK